MGTISGITFEKSNAIQTRHNDRDLPPSYLIEREKKDRIEVNRNHVEALKLKNQIIQEAIQTYTEKFNRKFIATSYEWSAVCNLKPDSKMEDLEKLAKHFEDKYGFQCYQIAIHRDEGHIDDEGNKVINHHAHMEFVTLEKNTGKNAQRTLTPLKLRQIQTETAEILQMQRGQDTRETKRKHLKPKLYRQMKEEERQNLKKEKQKYKELEELTTKRNKEEWLAQEKFIDGLEKEKDLYVLENQILTQELKEKDQELEKTKQELLTQKDVNKRLEEERQRMIKEREHTQEDYKLIREVKEGRYVSKEALEQAIAEKRKLMEEKKALERENLKLKMELNHQIIEKIDTELQAGMSQKSEPEPTTTPQPKPTQQNPYIRKR